MPFDTKLVAVSLHYGNYKVVATNECARINMTQLRADGVLRDASENSSYRDYIGAVSRNDFEKYILRNDGVGVASVRDWYDSLPEWARFILIHESEWESGC